MNIKSIILLFIFGTLFLTQETLSMEKDIGRQIVIEQEQRAKQWRKERDQFFRTHDRSPLSPLERRNFNGLKYYPLNPQYVFYGEIERFIFNINNPRYYATFPTNKGTNKRYIRYGKFHFMIDGKEYTIHIYKSILSDTLFIPFKDKTNGEETYEGGRYIDAEILPGCTMILDFNMAYNPSCAYNDKFVCVLPPQENVINTPIRAGEKIYILSTKNKRIDFLSETFHPSTNVNKQPIFLFFPCPLSDLETFRIISPLLSYSWRSL